MLFSQLQERCGSSPNHPSLLTTTSEIMRRNSAGRSGQTVITASKSGSGGSDTFSATPPSKIGVIGAVGPIGRVPVGVLLHICRRSQDAAPNAPDSHKATPRLTLRCRFRAQFDSTTLPTAVCCYAFCVASATDSATLFRGSPAQHSGQETARMVS